MIVYGGCTIIFCRFHIYIYIYITRKKWVFCLVFFLLLSSFICVQITKVHYDQMVLFVCLHIIPPHYHPYADLSKSIELPKCFSGTFCLECVSKVVSILSIIVHAINGAVGIQLTHSSYGDYGNTCTLSYYRHEIGSMTHVRFFEFRSWNGGMRCKFLYSLKMYFVKFWLLNKVFLIYIIITCAPALFTHANSEFVIYPLSWHDPLDLFNSF